jgi:hypothetical protein
MDWKEFFKPTITKIVMSILLVMLIPSTIHYDTGIRCIKAPCPAGSDASFVQYFINAPFSYIYSIFWIKLIPGIILSYLISCTIVLLFRKFKK